MSGGIKELVEKLIKENPIMIFSKSYCPYCQNAKNTIKKLNKDYKSIELDEEANGPAIQNYLEERTSQRTVPNIFINGQHIGGSDDLTAAESNGSLNEMIAVITDEYYLKQRTMSEIDIVINGLKTQISELKEIISGLNNDQNTSTTKSATSIAQIRPLEDERDALKIENSKFNYRITHLLRALDKKDRDLKKQTKLVKDF